jgi:hypothetical protein
VGRVALLLPSHDRGVESSRGRSPRYGSGVPGYPGQRVDSPPARGTTRAVANRLAKSLGEKLPPPLISHYVEGRPGAAYPRCMASALARLLCRARGGHRWETIEDAAGTFVQCSRCGSLRHAPGPGQHTKPSNLYMPPGGGDAAGDA